MFKNKSILLVHYKGCITFGGKKLILLKKEWDGRKYLDPHFLNDDHIVLARFEPNESGWALARWCAKLS